MILIYDQFDQFVFFLQLNTLIKSLAEVSTQIFNDTLFLVYADNHPCFSRN
jgi:hypothetical protein